MLSVLTSAFSQVSEMALASIAQVQAAVAGGGSAIEHAEDSVEQVVVRCRQ